MKKSPEQRLCSLCLSSGATFSMLLTNTVAIVIADATITHHFPEEKFCVFDFDIWPRDWETINMYSFRFSHLFRFLMLRTTVDDHDDDVDYPQFPETSDFVEFILQ